MGLIVNQKRRAKSLSNRFTEICISPILYIHTTKKLYIEWFTAILQELTWKKVPERKWKSGRKFRYRKKVPIPK